MIKSYGGLSRQPLRYGLLAMGFAVILSGSVTVQAQEDPQKNESQPQAAFEQLELDSMAFVQVNHEELVTLLKSLKAMRQKEYEVAIRDIGRTKKRLENLSKREPELSELELNAWKLKSKIDLMLAKGIANDKSFDKEVLRTLLTKQIDNQKKRWKHEQSTLAKRQEQLAESISKIEGHEAEKIEQQLATHLKSIENKSGKTKKSKQDAKSTNTDKEQP